MIRSFVSHSSVTYEISMYTIQKLYNKNQFIQNINFFSHSHSQWKLLETKMKITEVRHITVERSNVGHSD